MLESIPTSIKIAAPSFSLFGTHMILPPNIAFIAWGPVSLYCFWRYRVRTAILINFIAGWALLPSANYVPDTAIFPYWILGLSLPSSYFITKASVLGVYCLLGVLLADRRVFNRFRLTFWDLPMLFWCIVPFLSAVANPQSFAAGLRGVLYLALAWGVPYLMGRLYFSDTESLRLAAKAFVIAGLAYIPVCLLEVVTGPRVYAALYGYQPYRWIGAQRYLGFRPVGLLEDGNQLGIWMATSALIAIGLWKLHSVDRILGVPIATVAVILLGATLLCQSGGSILLLLALIPFIVVNERLLPRVLTVLLLLGIGCFAGLRLANVISLHSLVSHNVVADSAARVLSKAGRGSFGWRLSQDERYVNAALETPLLGSGEWDWWKGSSSRPWGLWMLTFGMYGIFGLLALESLQLLPVARTIFFPRARSSIEADYLRHVLAAAILMSTVDSLMNSAVVLPLLLAVGGLSAPSPVAVGVGASEHRRSDSLIASNV
jgi:hypothetical protein